MMAEAAGLVTVDFDEVVGALESIRIGMKDRFLALRTDPR